MGRSLWETFLVLFASGPESDDATDETDEGRFVPSPLDLSVRVAHGGSDDERVRALSEIEERARDLEDDRRDR